MPRCDITLEAAKVTAATATFAIKSAELHFVSKIQNAEKKVSSIVQAETEHFKESVIAQSERIREAAMERFKVLELKEGTANVKLDEIIGEFELQIDKEKDEPLYDKKDIGFRDANIVYTDDTPTEIDQKKVTCGASVSERNKTKNSIAIKRIIVWSRNEYYSNVCADLPPAAAYFKPCKGEKTIWEVFGLYINRKGNLPIENIMERFAVSHKPIALYNVAKWNDSLGKGWESVAPSADRSVLGPVYKALQLMLTSRMPFMKESPINKLVTRVNEFRNRRRTKQQQGKVKLDINLAIAQRLEGASTSTLLEQHGAGYVNYYKKIEEVTNKIKSEEGYKRLEEEMKDSVLKYWQQRVINKIKEQNDREILFVVDTKGGCGKTFLSKWMLVNMDACRLTNGKSADVKYMYNGKVNRKSEDIKNGIFNSTKYESKTVVTQKKTKIVCFMNFLPDMNKLSADRYHIMEINQLLQLKNQI
ncbi:hypothetical protein KUTeg_012233 [Tegillarca granosa]|uniref:Uncharacterized protein n=1 Tax=Tegillarca granosa TaxID=220873 RepID=A0ABQ9EYY9_TEGGR|nr:hypothetical protein KUTeg_012233 [Tegillarca granosa]